MKTKTYLPAIIGTEEIRAREMLIAYRTEKEWSVRRQAALSVWFACWSHQMYADRFNKIGNALHPHETPLDLQGELTNMVRAGLLRSRNGPIARLYELAL